MEEKVIVQDFIYHERTVKKMYENYYKKLLINLLVLLLLELVVSIIWGFYLINIVLILLLCGAIYFFVNKYQQFPIFYKQEQSQVKLVDFTEDGNHYYVKVEGLKFSKKNTRNLMSQQRDITFFVGTRLFNVMNPVVIRYYDHLEMSYTEEYKRNKNQVNFTVTRWKMRIRSGLKLLPIILLIAYILFF